MHKFPVERAGILDSSERGLILNPDDILDSAELNSDSVVADIGSGTGFFAIPASKRVSEGLVYAVDIQSEMHDILSRKISEEGLGNIETVLSTETLIPLDSESVDIAYIGNTLHELAELHTLSEVFRILRPGGRLIAVDWKKEETPMGPPKSHRLSEIEASALIESAGFTVTTVEDLGPYNYIINAVKSEAD
ncbi:MAG TPA: methyltransferase domain-containing protein [Euryarchaeota archaeon]|nr:ubiquinone/menaquinone biosynthesis C-methyltransferase UbiE [archaeon BMS3Bbin16]HDH28273.1 methyltransferase domain-containing protein [Euryarchaeota archaeon]